MAVAMLESWLVNNFQHPCALLSKSLAYIPINALNQFIFTIGRSIRTRKVRACALHGAFHAAGTNRCHSPQKSNTLPILLNAVCKRVRDTIGLHKTQPLACPSEIPGRRRSTPGSATPAFASGGLRWRPSPTPATWMQRNLNPLPTVREPPSMTLCLAGAGTLLLPALRLSLLSLNSLLARR